MGRSKGLEEAPCYIKRSIKEKVVRMFNNEHLEEEEIKILLRIKEIRPLAKEYLLKHIEKYNLFELLEVLLK